MKALEDDGHREIFEPRDVEDLLGRERVEAESVLRLHPAKEIFVPLDAQIGVEPALEENLNAPRVDHFLKLLSKHLARQDVPLGMTDRPVERAEAAARGAHVRVVDVAIDDVRDHTRGMLSATHGIRRETEIEELGLSDEALSFGGAQSLSRRCASEKRVERRGLGRRSPVLPPTATSQ